MKEEEIRPRKIFDEYLRLAAIDADKYFSGVSRREIPCPACAGKGEYVFSKHGFSYEECPSCRTLFVSPRPSAESFFRYYKESDSAQFFATTFYRETAEARREKLWRPKALMIKEKLKQYGADRHSLVDIGGGYGIFAEEYSRLTGIPVSVIEPGPELADTCRNKGFHVIESFLEKVTEEQLPEGPKAFVSFELFEHLHDAGVFLQHLHSLMHSEDIFIFTTLSGTGVDIQALWENSKSISLQHLNLFNPKSIQILIERASLSLVEVTTPGKLDIDILFNNRSLIKERFWQTLVDQTTESERQKWQDFIAQNGWSSHMSVVCRCP
ncbi:MAG: class I SAM-dependent methyltransferase [Proteobacteria bacterium]|nr:class I SAM-dependent methyltransferase [Bacteroidota bacterium]MBU1713412.1 class I SAM-dependent methyltransferase [Pseudomonadota bacterium]